VLKGDLVGLRARSEADVPILHAGLQDDVATWSSAHGTPWRPLSAGDDSPYAIKPATDEIAGFSVVTLADDELVGSALLWGIDSHNRAAHLGLGLLPETRGRGLSTDIVKVLCHYGFVVRGLRRLQLETLAGNAPMIAAAKRSGFLLEGTLREAVYVLGDILDEVIYGLLAADWAGLAPTPT
jgi:RimJ/RimL family protein N-acetyltransferase